MKRLILLLLCWALCVPALAQASYEEAVALYEDKDFPGARRIAETLARAGDARAMAMLGVLYQEGFGVAADLNRAVDWYAQAAEKGNVGAQYSLAVIYIDGALGEPDLERGRHWLALAAAQGKPEALQRLGLLAASERPPDWTNAVRWFEKAAAQGYADAEYNLGILYAEGRGVDEDDVKAGEWFAKAAVKGHPDAALDYGIMVFLGQGVKKNEKVGADWLLVSARHGNPVAQNRVARLYATGRVLDVDAAEAMKWHILAKKGGRGDAWLDEFVARLPSAAQKDAAARAEAFRPQQRR